MKLKGWLILVVVVGLALLVRLWRLDKIPAGLYYDEIDLGYQVKSLISTGRDYRGEISPFFVRSFNTDKTPIPVYWSMIGSILKDPTLSVRVPTAIMGTIVVALLMGIVLLGTGSVLAVGIVGIVAAFSPWLVHFSRIAFEASYALAFYLGFVLLLIKWLKQQKLVDYYLMILLLSLTLYTYRIMSFYAPLTFLMVGVMFYKKFLMLGVKHLVIGGFMALIICGSFIYATTFGAKDQTRIAQISVFSNTQVPIDVMRGREIDSGDFKKEKLGQAPVLESYAFHNKVLGWLSGLKNNYLESWSTSFLFISGDGNPRQGVGKFGELLLIDVIGLLAGLWFLVAKRKDNLNKWLIAMLVSAPIPAAITMGGGSHASRLIIFGGAMVLITGLGWWQISDFIIKKKQWILGVILLGVWITSAGFYLHRYFVHFAVDLETARGHGYGYEQIVGKIKERENDYKRVVLSDTYDPPMLHYLFWAMVPPREIQEYGTEFGAEVIKNKPLDKYKVIGWSKITEKVKNKELDSALEDGSLYMVTQRDINSYLDNGQWPKNVEVVDMVYYPDNSEVAFYLIRRQETK